MSDTSAVERKLGEEIAKACGLKTKYLVFRTTLERALWRALVARETERRWIPVSQESARELSRKIFLAYMDYEDDAGMDAVCEFATRDFGTEKIAQMIISHFSQPPERSAE